MFKKRTQAAEPNRRRTQPDTQTNKIFSYYANRNPYDGASKARDAGQGEAVANRARQGRRAGRVLLGWVLLVITLFFVVYNTTLSKDMEVQISGKPEERLLLQSPSEYQQAAQELLGKKLTSKTKLTVNTSEVSEQLLKSYPELATADIALPLIGRTPTLQLTPTPIAAKLTDSTGKSYVLSGDGRAISINTDVAPAEAPTVTDQSGLAVTVGSQVLPRDDMRFITRLNYQFQEQNIPIESLSLPAAGRQVLVRVKDKPYLIKFSLEDEVLQQVGAYRAVQKKLDADGVTPAEYIDVRVGDRAYYK